MPSTPYAKLLVSVNAGPTQSGGIVASNGDTIQFSAESTAQWDLTIPPRWEIYAYPPGWTGPGVGWTTESVPQPFGGSADVYVYLGLGPPPSFTLPVLPIWGDFLCRLTVSGGLANGRIAPQLVDQTTALRVIGPNGLLDIAVGAETQFSNRSWVGAWQTSLRLLDAALAGSSTPYALPAEPIIIGAGSAGGINQYARGDHEHFVAVGSPQDIGLANSAGGGTALAGAGHVHRLPFSTLQSVLALASSALDTNGQTLTTGGFIGPYFATNATPVATGGLLRGANATTLASARNAANGANVIALGTNASDHVILGGANAAAIVLESVVGGFIDFTTATTQIARLETTALTFGPSASFALAQDAAVSGAGAQATIFAQSATTSGQGGDLKLFPGLGAGGDPAGDLHLDLRDDGTNSGWLYFDAGSFGMISRRRYQNASTTVVEETPTGVALSSYWDGGITFETATGGLVTINKSLWVTDAGVSMFVAPNFGAAEGLLHIGDVTTAPTVVPAEGVDVWQTSLGTQFRNATNVLDVVCPGLVTGTGTGDDLRAKDRSAARVQTNAAGTTTALTYALRPSCTCDFTAIILAYVPSSPARARYVVTGAAGRLGVAAASLIGATDTNTKEDPAAAALNGSVTVFGNDLVVQITADSALVEWFVTLDVTMMKPA
jgi:hypothetical protein